MITAMGLTLDQIVAEAAGLPQEAIIELIDRLMLRIHGGIEPAAERAWSQEIHRRVAEIRGGKEPGIPGEQVSAEIRKIVGL